MSLNGLAAPLLAMLMHTVCASAPVKQGNEGPQELSTDDGKPLTPWCLAYSPDGRFLAVGGSRNGLWNVAEMPPKKVKVIAPREFIMAIAFSTDGRMMATLSGISKNEPVPAAACILKIWNCKTDELLHTVKDSNEPLDMDLGSVSFSPDGRLLAVSCNDVLVIDVKSGKEIAKLSGAIGPVRFSGDGKSVLAVDSKESWVIKEWNLATGKDMRSFSRSKPAGSCTGFEVSAQGFLAALDDDGIMVWSLKSGKVQFQKPFTNSPDAVAFSPDGQVVAVAGHRTPTRFWDINTGKEVFRIPPDPLLPTIVSLAYSPDGTRIAQGAVIAYSGHYTPVRGRVRISNIPNNQK